MMSARLRAMVVGAVILALFGCETPRETAEAIRHRAQDAEDALTRLPKNASVRAGMVSVHDGIWVGGRSVLAPNGEPLPVSAQSANAIVINSLGAALDLREIAAEIAAQSGIKVVLEEAPAGLDGAPASTDAASRVSSPGPSFRRPMGMALSWSGPLGGLLDSMAAYFGVEWEYRGGQIRMFRYEVRTFTLAALPSHSTVRAGVSTTGGGGSAPGGATGGSSPASGSMVQDTTNETSIKLWDDIKESVLAMLPAGAKATLSPATGTVTVIAPPLAMRRIAAYIEQQNDLITRQVTISVKILRVDLNDTYDLGLDLNVVFQQLAGQYAVSLAGPAPLKVTAGTPASYLVQAIQNTQTGKGHWATGSSAAQTTHALVDALQTMGKVTLTTETSVTTLNGQAAPVSVAEQQSYVASTATTLASGATAMTQTQVTPATLVTGFNMQVLPRVLDDGQVLLQYGLSLSDLKALTEFDSDGTRVQLPDVNIRSFLQQAIMRSGDLLVLAGYQSATDNLGNSGLPGLGPSLLGGSVQSTNSKSVIVIMMAPEVAARRSESLL